MTLPLNDCYVTSQYGIVRSNGKVHTGIDLISKSGDREVKAIVSGWYRGAYYDKYGYGNYVVIENDDGMRTLYCHLEKVFQFNVGQFIKQSTVIGIEGTTGNSTGIHLHLEIREKPYTSGTHRDIAKYLGIANVKGNVQILPKKEEEVIMEILKRLVNKYGEENVEHALDRLCATFVDDKEPASWAIAEIEKAKELGITDGTHPEMWATRQEVMMMCERTYEKAKNG